MSSLSTTWLLEVGQRFHLNIEKSLSIVNILFHVSRLPLRGVGQCNNTYKTLQTHNGKAEVGTSILQMCTTISNRLLRIVYANLPDLDPCIDVTCHYHCLCKAFGPNDARCVAVDSCPSYQEPVCSSNGTTYDNECLFRQEMCIQRLNFSVQHPGSCEG